MEASHGSISWSEVFAVQVVFNLICYLVEIAFLILLGLGAEDTLQPSPSSSVLTPDACGLLPSSL